MSKKSDKNKEQFPIEFPARDFKSKHSPITDVINNETYPMEAHSDKNFDNIRPRRNSGVHFTSYDNGITVFDDTVENEIFPMKWFYCIIPRFLVW